MSGGVPRWYRRLKLQHYAIVAGSIVVMTFGVALFPHLPELIVIPIATLIVSNIRVGWIVTKRKHMELSNLGTVCPICEYNAVDIPEIDNLIQCPECGKRFSREQRIADAEKHWGAFRRQRE